MLSNKAVVEAFANKQVAHSGSMWVSYDGQRLYSYETCIAQHVGNVVVLNATKYSVTTSKQQTIVRCMCRGCVEVTGIKWYADDLTAAYRKAQREARKKVA